VLDCFAKFVTEGLVLGCRGRHAGITFWLLGHAAVLKLIPADMLAGMPYLNEIGLNFACLRLQARSASWHVCSFR